MTTPIAKPVVKNKFWVVENHGQKIATIQARDDGGFVYVHDELREFFPSVKNHILCFFRTHTGLAKNSSFIKNNLNKIDRLSCVIT